MLAAVAYDYDTPNSARRVELLDFEYDSIPFDRIQCPDLRQIGRVWLDYPRQTGQALPQWRQFSPVQFRSMIDKLCVLSVEDWSTEQLEFTLYGGHPTEYIGLGKPLSLQEMRADPFRRNNYADIRDRARRATRNETPQYARKTLSWNDHDFIEYEVLMLPFAPEGGSQRILQPVSAHLVSD